MNALRNFGGKVMCHFHRHDWQALYEQGIYSFSVVVCARCDTLAWRK